MDVEKKISIFTNSFIRFCEEKGEYYESVVLKLGKPELSEECENVITVLEYGAVVGDIFGGLATIPLGVPIPVGSIITLPIKSSVDLYGKKKTILAAEKIAGAMSFAQDDDYVTRLVLYEGIREIAIAYEYQLSLLQEKKDVMLLAASAAKRIINFLQTRHKGWSLDVDGVIEGILTGHSSKHVLLGTIMDDKLLENANYQSMVKALFSSNAIYWNSDSVFAKTGLITQDGKFYASSQSRAEKYGYRRSLLPSVDNRYSIEEMPKGIPSIIPYNPCKVPVSYSDIAEYAKKHRDASDPKARGNFNQYIAAIHNNNGLQAICRTGPTAGDSLDLSGADLSNSDFMAMSFERVNLSNANLEEALLGSASFKDANLENAKLVKAYAARATFEHADLTNADFEGADLTCAVLDNIKKLRKCNFVNSNLQGISFENTKLDEAILDNNFIKAFKKTEEIVQHLAATAILTAQQYAEHEKRLHKLEGSEKAYEPPLIQEIKPEVNHYYQGERDLRLEQCFLAKPRVLLLGIAGAGKTQLARHYAKTYLSQHTEAMVYEFSAASISMLEKSYYDLAIQMLGAKAIDNKPVKDILPLFFARLRAEKNSLLIFDNVDDDLVKHRLNQDLQGICNGADKGKTQQILVTSQDGHLSMMGGFNTLRIVGWPPNEATLFLTGNLGVIDAPNEVKKLAEIFDCLPLALDAARLYIQDKGISVATYLNRIEDEKNSMRVEVEEAGLMEAFYSKEEAHTQKAAIRLAIKAIEDAEAIKMLQSCSFLAAEKIPFSLLTELDNQLQLDKTEAEMKVEKQLTALKKYSLILNMVGIDDNRMVAFHRIVQKVSRELMTPEQRKVCIEELANLLAQHFTRNNVKQSNLSNNLILLPHVESLIEHATKHGLNATSVVALKIAAATYHDFNGAHLQAAEILAEVKLALEANNLIDENSASVVCQQLVDKDKALPTLYGQVLYHLGKSYLSLWQNEKNESEASHYQTLAKINLERAVKVREIIDEAKELYDDRFNDEKPKPMDSSIFKRNGLFLWYKLEGSSENLKLAIDGFHGLIEQELAEAKIKQDPFHLATCRRLEIESRLAFASNKDITAAEKIVCLNGALDAVSENLNIKHTLDTTDVNRTRLLNLLFEQLQGRSEEVRIGREYNLIGKISFELYLLTHNEDVLAWAKKFLTFTKKLEESNNRKNFILEDANKLLMQIDDIEKSHLKSSSLTSGLNSLLCRNDKASARSFVINNEDNNITQMLDAQSSAKNINEEELAQPMKQERAAAIIRRSWCEYVAAKKAQVSMSNDGISK